MVSTRSQRKKKVEESLNGGGDDGSVEVSGTAEDEGMEVENALGNGTGSDNEDAGEEIVEKEVNMASTRSQQKKKADESLHHGGGEVGCDEVSETVSEEDDSEEKEGRDISREGNKRYMTAEKCIGRVLLHCPWPSCDWVKPVPEKWNPQQLVSHRRDRDGTGYVCYLSKKPPEKMKRDNCYKKTVQHAWYCKHRGSSKRSDFGPFFDKTYKGKPTKEPRRFDSDLEPRKQKRDGNRKKYKTKDDYAGDNTVLICNICDYVKLWPENKRELLESVRVERMDGNGPLYVVLEQDPTAGMRREPVWRKMRRHCLDCCGEGESGIPAMYKSARIVWN
jgi:hypothetical protein